MGEKKVFIRLGVKNVENLSAAFSEIDVLEELWKRESQSILAPAGEWLENGLPITFRGRTFIYLFFACLFVIPGLFYIPYLISKFLERKLLRDKIAKERRVIKTVSPVPILYQSDFTEILESSIGRRLMNEGVLFKAFLAE